MAAAKLNIRLERGTTLYRQIIIKGAAVPVGTTYHLHILENPEAEVAVDEFGSVALESALGTSFSMELLADAAIAGGLPNGSYFYKIEAIIPNTLAVIRMLQGNLVLAP